MKCNILFGAMLLGVVAIACSDDNEINNGANNKPGAPEEELPEWYYAGGELGTALYVAKYAVPNSPPA